ncbi:MULTISPECIES: antibiotic biosynthesis monooxygenase [Niastella]|uniref:Antibiotic biosynthesis monooxygenase n=1 Tax=Niastella soli TaxID=2821487 RepID=A0ABS3Z4K5_9BACT|nr:antibiotic biosynthesis monooxygenase [Niastella soli]MBO9204311.1 antibiotic biosynthesis monooxygenase [Niastella soli]
MSANAWMSNSNRPFVLIITFLLAITSYTKAQNVSKMKKKILFVVTSHSQKGNTGEKTGFYLAEAAHPWEVLTNAGYEIDFVSPKGGKAPVDGLNLGDAVNKKFWNDAVYRQKIEKTQKPSAIDPGQYIAIHYVGGHGAMWDFEDNRELASIAAKIYENGGVVSAVCHGPAGLVNIKLSNGKYLVDGKKINAFSNEEEVAVKLDKAVPFLLESKLIERGAIFEKSGLWQSHVVTDQRVVTGQNPQSAKAVGEAVLAILSQQDAVARLTRYEVRSEYQDQFRKAVTDYVSCAMAIESNIMAEAYYEKENPAILWVIERWVSNEEWTKSRNNAQSKAISRLAEIALVKPQKSITIKDLEPISKQQWRRTANAADSQLTIMLFVDAKAGTQETFRNVYHIAMPQFRSEPGVITYQLSQLEEDDTQFVTYEKFRSNEAFQYHLNFPPIKPVIDYLNSSIKKQPFQDGLHNLIEFAPLIRE